MMPHTHVPLSVRLRHGFSYLLLLSAVVLAGGCASLSGNTQDRVLAARNRVAPALVHIRPVKEVFVSGKRTEVLTVGSGFIISADGYIVTNEHVAGESSEVWCILSDNTEHEARVVGVDPYTDVAVLKIEADRPFPYVRWGDSDAIEAGQMVLAMGSPHGLARSVSLGIISVRDRYLENASGMSSPYNNWIQTDAAINPGNSGGPLVNLKGDVVGINARMLSGAENLGFAIPANIARQVVTQIIDHGSVRRSALGLVFQEMTSKTDDLSARGVVIADVAPLSASYEAGVRPGDILIRLGNRPMHARHEEELPAVRKAVADLPVGEPVTLVLERGGEEMSFSVVTEEESAYKGRNAEFSEWGFTLVELTPDLARRAQLPGHTGVLVSGCLPGGLAASSGLTPGDIILKLDDTPVASLSDFMNLYKSVQENRKALTMLFVQKGALTRFVLIDQTNSKSSILDKEVLDHVD